MKYDDVMNKQREIIYGQRRSVLMGEDLGGNIQNMLEEVIGGEVEVHCPENMYPEEWDMQSLRLALAEVIPGAPLPLFDGVEIETLTAKKAREMILEQARQRYAEKEAELTAEGFDMREIERVVLLRMVDDKWMEHIDNMDQLRQGIGLRAYGQVDPVVAFRKESADVFDEMVANIELDTIKMLFRVTVKSKVERVQTMNPTAEGHGGDEPRPKGQRRAEKKVGRNDPCPCGSGKKYKNCCGR